MVARQRRDGGQTATWWWPDSKPTLVSMWSRACDTACFDCMFLWYNVPCFYCTVLHAKCWLYRTVLYCACYTHHPDHTCMSNANICIPSFCLSTPLFVFSFPLFSACHPSPSLTHIVLCVTLSVDLTYILTWPAWPWPQGDPGPPGLPSGLPPVESDSEADWAVRVITLKVVLTIIKSTLYRSNPFNQSIKFFMLFL